MSILLTGEQMQKHMQDRLPWQVYQLHDGQPVLYLCPSCFAVIPNMTFEGTQKTAIQFHIDWHALVHNAINSYDGVRQRVRDLEAQVEELEQIRHYGEVSPE